VSQLQVLTFPPARARGRGGGSGSIQCSIRFGTDPRFQKLTAPANAK